MSGAKESLDLDSNRRGRIEHCRHLVPAVARYGEIPASGRLPSRLRPDKTIAFVLRGLADVNRNGAPDLLLGSGDPEPRDWLLHLGLGRCRPSSGPGKAADRGRD